MFIAHLPYVDPLFFHLATQQNQETHAVQGAEKTAFAWSDTNPRTPLTLLVLPWSKCSAMLR